LIPPFSLPPVLTSPIPTQSLSLYSAILIVLQISPSPFGGEEVNIFDPS
jgi:hypothetical protein